MVGSGRAPQKCALFNRLLGGRRASPVFLVTEFSFKLVVLRIDSIIVLSNQVQIDFTATPISSKPAQIEGASAVDGPYAVELNVRYTPTGENKIRATFPISTMNRFFRVRLE
jgi:hypothetical protein